MTGVAGVGLLDRDADRHAAQGVVERDGDLGLQVGAALGGLPAPAGAGSSAAGGAAEQAGKQVARSPISNVAPPCWNMRGSKPWKPP